MPRERLFGWLDTMRPRGLVWISAPPGSGKTSLVSSYLQARPGACLWYQLDPGDADPGTFFHYLGIAERERRGKKPGALPTFTAEDAVGPAGFARRFFRQLLSELPANTMLVFDNWQEVPDGAPLLGALALACEEAPSGVAIVVLSHAPLPASFGRLLATGRVACLTWEEIQLDFDETARLAQRDGELPEATLRALHEQTGGWPAGLVLLLDELRRTGRIDRLDHAESRESVFGFFATQVLHAFPDAAQDMLLRMSYLPRMTDETAAALTGEPESAALLAWLARRNLFTDRRVGEPTSFEFHALFRAFLQQRARQRFGAPEHRKIMLAAASLLQALGAAADAFPLLAEAGAWEPAARLVARSADTLSRQGRLHTLRGWLEMLPPARFEDDPRLIYWHAMALMGTEFARGRELLAQAHARLAAAGDWNGAVLAASNLLVASIRLSLHECDRWLDELDRLVATSPQDADVATLAHAQSIRLAVTFRRRPTSPALHELARDVEALIDEALEPEIMLALAGSLLYYLWWMGFGEDGKALVARMRPVLDDPGVGVRAKVSYALFLAHQHLGTGEYDEVSKAIEWASLLEDPSGLSPLRSDFTLFQAATLRIRGDEEGALRALCEDFALALGSTRKENVSFYFSNRALLSLCFSRPEEAGRYADEGLRLAEEHGLGSARMFLPITKALAEIESGCYENARQRLASHRLAVEAAGSPALSLSFDLALAHVHDREGKPEALEATLRSAFEKAARSGVTNVHVILRSQAARLCEVALARGIEPDYVRGLLRRRGWTSPHLDTEAWPWPLGIRTLGGLQVTRDGKPVSTGAKAQYKLMALLEAIIAIGKDGVGMQTLADGLWPDSDGSSAQNTLQVSLYRLRRMLGCDNAVHVHEGRVKLTREACWVDAWALEDKFERFVTLNPCMPAWDSLGNEILALYRGSFLAGRREHSWTLAARDRLRRAWLTVARALGDAYEARQSWRRAADLYGKVLDADPSPEDIYRRLIRCLGELGERAEVASTYSRLRHQLRTHLGVRPDAHTERLYRSVMEPMASDET